MCVKELPGASLCLPNHSWGVAVPAQASFDTSCLTPTQTSPARNPQVSGTPGVDEVPIPRLRVTFPPQPSAHVAAPSPAESSHSAFLKPYCSSLVLW
jgi:hypothetical protein